MTLRTMLQNAIRPSRTHSLAALWVKSLLNAALFFAAFMVALPWLAHRLLPWRLPIPTPLRAWGAGLLALTGVVGWLACLNAFSQLGRGTPLPVDAPRRLVTTGPFAVIRNPIMASELMVIWAVALYLARTRFGLNVRAVGV